MEQEIVQTIELGQYFVDTASLAILVASVVAFIKQHVYKLDGIFTVLASVVLGALLGVAGRALGFLDTTLLQAALFGVSAGVVASGGWDLLTGILGKNEKQAE